MRFSKKAQSGEAVLMIVRLFLLMLIAFSIYFISGLNLDYHLDTKNVEANILGNLVFDCISNSGSVRISELPRENNEISNYCGIKGTEKAYIKINISVNGREVFSVMENSQYKESLYLYNLPGTNTEATQKYKPGHSEIERGAWVITGDKTLRGLIKIEVILENEI